MSDSESDYEHNYYRPSFEELADLVNDRDNIVVVCGAGLSYDVAPLADTVKRCLLNAVQELSSQVKERSKAETDEINKKYFTLELFASGLRHRVPSLTKSMTDLYSNIFTLPELNRAHVSLAKAMGHFTAAGKRATVLTANFDDGVQKALRQLGIDYRLITRNNVSQVMAGDDRNRNAAPKVDICAYHGTIEKSAPNDHVTPSPPTSMTAQNLAHPFPPSLSMYFQRTLAHTGAILFIGHRGEDFYDLNVELQRAVRKYTEDSGHPAARKFLCLPHKGQPECIHESYRKLFGDAGVACIRGIEEDDEWVADLFDRISGQTTGPTMVRPARMTDAEWQEKTDLEVAGLSNKLIQLVNNQFGTQGSTDRWVLQRQCAALLNNIHNSALAAWTALGHLRQPLGGALKECLHNIIGWAFTRAVPKRLGISNITQGKIVLGQGEGRRGKQNPANR